MQIKQFICDQSGPRITTWQEFPDGRLVMPVTLTRTGVFKYKYHEIFGNNEHPDYPKAMFKDGIISVYRSFDEVSKSIDSMRGMYFTDEHPEEFVNSKNWQKLSKGQFGTEINIREEKFNDFSLHFFDSFVTAVDDKQKDYIKKKIKDQVSLGYVAFFVYQPDVFGGVAYDMLQVDIENNHGALTKYGRAGSKVKIKSSMGDSGLFWITDTETIFETNEENLFVMDLRGIKIEFKDSASEKLVESELKEKEAEIATLKEKVKTVDSLEAKVIKLEKDVLDSKNVDHEAIAEERTSTIEKAKQYIKDSKPETFKGKSIPEIKKMAVLDHYKGKDLTGKTDEILGELFGLLDDKPKAAPVIPGKKIGDSFSGTPPVQTQDSGNLIDNLAKQLTNAYLPVKQEA